MTPDRTKVMTALDNLEPHSPTWVAMIRDYIKDLESKVETKEEGARK